MRVGAMCRVLPIECTYFVGHVLYLNHTAGTYCSVVFESSGGDGGLFEILTQKKKNKKNLKTKPKQNIIKQKKIAMQSEDQIPNP